MINNYTNFLIEKELKYWIKIEKNLNEDNSSENLRDRIFNYLDEAARKGDEAIIKVAKKIFDFFNKNPKILILVIGILVSKYNFSKKQIIDIFSDTNTISAEKIYAKVKNDSELSNVKINGNLKKFLNAIAHKESTNDPEKVNNLGYMGKYQFGEIALKDILQKKSSESDEDYGKRIKQYWPKNFGKLKSEADFNYFQSKFKNKGVNFWPEHKQDLAMKQLLKNNKSYLGDYIDKWVGKKKNGIEITLSGLLAGAHLLGPSNVKNFLDHGKISKDGYGTPITEYIKKFGGYKVNI